MKIVKKVKIVKEVKGVIACDVSPVAMFNLIMLHVQISMLQYMWFRYTIIIIIAVIVIIIIMSECNEYERRLGGTAV